MKLDVERIDHASGLSQDDLDCWNDLARNPLQRWEWLGSWWDAFQGDNQLCVLKVLGDGVPVAFAPWFLSNRLGTGRTIEFLGSGKACSDHVSLIVSPKNSEHAADAIAKWLAQDESVSQCHWDSLEWIGVDSDDAPINQLVDSMKTQGLSVDRREGMGCYVIDLPATWDDYVRMRSKSGRREARQAVKNIDEGRIVVRRVQDEAGLDAVWDHFVRLHQLRREEAGTTACFDYPHFESFLRTAASRMLESGMLEFLVAESDGVPVAAQFSMVDENAWYYYQSGMAPDASDLRPGVSLFCHAIRQTIETGRNRFDMMRGDEPYKMRWRAELKASQEIRACSNRTASQIRNQVYKAGITFKNLVKSGFGIGQHQ